MRTQSRLHRRSAAFTVAVAVLVGIGTESGLSAPVQAAPTKQDANQRAIRGRLVDDKKSPIVNALVRPCSQAKEPDGSFSTFFAMFTNGTWADARTDETGTFTFEHELAPRQYCLAVEFRGTMTILKGANGETLQFEVPTKPGKMDWGEIVVRR